jgi:hypothetical protein
MLNERMEAPDARHVIKVPLYPLHLNAPPSSVSSHPLVEPSPLLRFTWADAPVDAVLFDFVGAGVEFRNVSLQAGEAEHVVRVPGT